MKSPRKVVLINPRTASKRSKRFPLSLLALGAVLEGRYAYRIIDENADPDPICTARAALDDDPTALIGMTVMPGPQVVPAIKIASALRQSHPDVPIVWGGYFPTLYPDAAINAPYVDYVVRGQGEATLLELVDALPAAGVNSLAGIRGLTWKDGSAIRHNAERHFTGPDTLPDLPYDRLDNPEQYIRPSFMGSRTAVHQAAIGCRYKCTFCGVVSMFNGLTRLSSPERLSAVLTNLRDRFGVNAMTYYDNNFFDREETTVPMLEAMGRVVLPYWCYARADTLAKCSAGTWELIRKSGLRMAYIGAEAATDAVLKEMKKGTRVEQTIEVARRAREYGVIPEFSFILGGPDDPEGEIETTFAFIRKLKKINPACEIILYFYSPTPQRASRSTDSEGGVDLPMLGSYGPGGPALPTTPEEWAQPEWVEYVCHNDAPWLSSRTRQRVKDFATVLACRFPTAQDYHTPEWGKTVLRGMASWRYASGHYGKPRELEMAKRSFALRVPQKESV